ncbi:MAG: uracil-DNA glycosylase [Clostridia bacterium]|nr:uracil-DNA glycosylase [Clostridia bacterium]
MEKDWEQLKEECLSCRRCGLCETRTNVVFGQGNPNARLMFIGEGPGETEDLTGLPFVGRSGKLLDKFIEAIGYSREDVFIANMVKCRPPQNRDPKPEEMELCLDYLRRQVKLINPDLIVCLGRVAAARLIDPNIKVTKEHGTIIKKGNYNFMATFHPAALLRNPNQKPQAFEDFLKIKEILEK